MQREADSRHAELIIEQLSEVSDRPGVICRIDGSDELDDDTDADIDALLLHDSGVSQRCAIIRF